MEYKKLILPFCIFIIILIIPHPEPITYKGWVYFALFVSIIVCLIKEPMPSAAIGLFGITIASIFRLVYDTSAESAKWALSGFSNSTIWLIFIGYMFSKAFHKTGLGKRIALTLIKKFGKNSLFLGYIITFSNFIISPFIPTNTGRNAGIIYPIISNIPPLYNSFPHKNQKRIGAYIMWTAFSTDCIISSFFLTALAPNLLAISLAERYVNITWIDWFIGFLPLGLILIFSIPLIIYLIYPPEIKHSEEIVKFAKNELQNIGNVKKTEKHLVLLMVLALILWIAGSNIVNSTIVAMLVLLLMITFNIIEWDDVLSNKSGWNILIWFGTLVTLADGLYKVGIISFVANLLGSLINNIDSTYLSIVIILAAFYFIHYGFASMTAHVAALFPLFLSLLINISGINPKIATLLLSYIIGLFGVITPYATGPAPIYFGSNYINKSEFWKLGFIFGVIYFISYIIIEVNWLRFIYS